MQDILQQLSPILGNPALWLAVTLVAFIFGQHLYKLTQFNPLFTPIIVAVVSIIVVLLVMGVPYEQYFQASFTSCSGPRPWCSLCRSSSSARSSSSSGCPSPAAFSQAAWPPSSPSLPSAGSSDSRPKQ